MHVCVSSIPVIEIELFHVFHYSYEVYHRKGQRSYDLQLWSAEVTHTAYTYGVRIVGTEEVKNIQLSVVGE